jgi:hypothetical protein
MKLFKEGHRAPRSTSGGIHGSSFGGFPSSISRHGYAIEKLNYTFWVDVNGHVRRTILFYVREGQAKEEEGLLMVLFSHYWLELGQNKRRNQ